MASGETASDKDGEAIAQGRRARRNWAVGDKRRQTERGGRAPREGGTGWDRARAFCATILRQAGTPEAAIAAQMW